MKIHELEQLSGLDRATIRYYEKEGLISPERLENGYREYSQTDHQQLLKIKLLRQLELPLDTIKQLQRGSVDFTQVLQDQAKALSQKIESMERAVEVCNEISDTAVSYQNLDAQQYLEKMRQARQEQAPQKPAESAIVTREYHPVRRLVARFLDYTLLSVLLRFILFVVLRIRLFSDDLSTVIAYAVPFLAVPVLALAECKFGTTAGKWLMGIRLEPYYDMHLPIGDALKREWDALRYGYGFGIPIWRIWRMYRSYKDYDDGVELKQDELVEHVYSEWNVWKKSVFAAICVVIILLNTVIATDLTKPRYRGNDLTIAEFAENFNYYMSILDEDSTLRMEPDGSWQERSSTNTGIVINLGGKAQNENETFEFDTEGETVTRISYRNTWTDFLNLNPISTKLIAASITAVMSQKGIGYTKMKDFAEIWADNADLVETEVRYENVTIRWNVEAVSCTLNGERYIPVESDEEPSVTLHFEIIIE